MRYMLDTNICIYAIKKKPEEVFRRLQQHDPSEVCISAVTYAELMHGVEKSKAVEKNRLALTLLLANIEILDFDSLAAESYGASKEFSGKLRQSPRWATTITELWSRFISFSRICVTRS